MNLLRSRVSLGSRIAASPGVPFAACTRVGHGDRLLFEQELPSYEVFQQARLSENFRCRVRYELRLQAAASRTLRKYRFCAADPWTEEEVAVAETLLRGLANRAGMQRDRLRLRGFAVSHPDAYLWPDEEPPLVVG